MHFRLAATESGEQLVRAEQVFAGLPGKGAVIFMARRDWV